MYNKCDNVTYTVDNCVDTYLYARYSSDICNATVFIA